MIREETIFGVTYYTDDCLAYGDYDNSCSIERANVRVLLERAQEEKRSAWRVWITDLPHAELEKGERPPELIVEESAYDGVRLYIRADVWDAWGLDVLEEYPVVDEEALSHWEHERLIDHANSEVGSWQWTLEERLGKEPVEETLINLFLGFWYEGNGHGGFPNGRPDYDEEEFLDFVERHVTGE